jgi:hypothetical protein
LIPVEQDRNGNSVNADVTDDTPLKTFRMTLASAIFRQFGSCFEPFEFAG